MERELILVMWIKLVKTCFSFFKNQLIFCLGLFFIWEYPQDYPKGPMFSLGTFEHGWACIDTLKQK